MTMKLLFKHTSTIILRAALLLGAMAFVNTQTKAQTAAQWAEMPDAFETMSPSDIIGDGNYYYIQFYQDDHTKCSYLTDCGVNKIAKSKDFLPYAYNRLWTLVSANDGNANHFYLKNKAGHYISFGTFESKSRVGCVDNSGSASILTFHSLGDGYDISRASDDGSSEGVFPMYRPSYVEWAELAYNSKKGSSSVFNVFRLRFAKLKSTAAFIIYYRGEHTDGNDNTSAGETTTRHYLTYSGTGNESPARDGYFRDSEVSSRRSIIPSDKPLCTLPTLAAYHQDGLWTLEGTGVDGQFYIKKYGTEEYLNLVQLGSDGFKTGVLGVKDNLNGNYTLVDRDANRYTLVQNVKYNGTALASSMFNNTVENNVGAADPLSAGATVIGSGGVESGTYADLTTYSKMVINGSQDTQLRVLMNRLDGNGYWVERNATIGSDGTAVVDLTGCNVGQGTVKMTYINGNDDQLSTSYGEIAAGEAAYCGYNRILNGSVELMNKGWGVNNVAYLQVDASAIDGTIKKVTLTGDFQQIAARPMEYGVGYNNSDWTSTMTWETADRSITTLGGTQTVEKATADKTLSFDITGAFGDSKVKTIMVYNLAAGAGYIKNPKVYVEYEPNDASTRYVHLNAIKMGWGSPNGTVTSINLMSENTGDTHYLHHAKGDGWQLMEWTGVDNDYFNAGFYPVEVPVPNKDDYFQVLVKWSVSGEDRMINHNGGYTTPFPTNVADYDLWQLEMIDDYLHYRLKAPNGRYLKPKGTGMTDPNDPTDAEVNTNAKFYTDFSLTWYYVDPAAVPKEIPVDYMVTHRMSYLKQYSDQYADLDLEKQGLATDAQSDWWNYDKSIQKTNHFEITHYVKKGNTITVEFPTVLNKNNDHIYYQRFYNYDETDASMDLDNLKAHVSLNTRDDGNVQYFLYRNGMVTGQKLDWTGIADGGYARNVQRRFNFTNSDGNSFTVAADVSRYSDLTYQNADSHRDGNLEEPSLTMRYIYYMNDAKDMAKRLTACTEGSGNWLESKVFHFPAKQIFYEKQKRVGYRGEFIGLRHVFSDYWVFNDGNASSTDDNNLVSAVDNASGGKIEVQIVDDAVNPTLIRLGGWNPTLAAANGGNLKFTDAVDTYDAATEADFRGFYFYDKMSDQNKTQYGDSRFVVFRYPASGEVTVPTDPNVEQKAYINVYLNNNGTRYQLAQFTIIFDKGTVTLPYTAVNSSSYVKDDGTNHQYKDRDPKKLIEKAGKPIAKITFDYPSGDKYHFPVGSETRHGNGYGNDNGSGNTVNNSSPVPLVFDKTNYAFDAFECNWGSYAMVTQMSTNYGNKKTALPANDNTYGYGDASVTALQADKNLQKAFLYIDASEQPGDICSAPFLGDFCSGDKLMFSGWISSSNKAGGTDNRCPGGVTLTVKGEHNLHNSDGTIMYDEKGNPLKETVTLYRFCPGQIYELDNGSQADGSGQTWNDTDKKYDDDNSANHVVWQQFYFEFKVTDKYDRHWIEVNNNCVSSQGGDFMLDNIEVYAIVPEVTPQINTPLCISVNEDGTLVTDMRLLKLSVDFNKQKSSANLNSGEAELGFVFLDKEVFLKTFRTELQKLTDTQKATLGLTAYDFSTITLSALADAIKDGGLKGITGDHSAYQTAFDAAILGNKTTWHSGNPSVNMNSSVMYFKYNSDFSAMPTYSFAKAVNKTSPVYGEEVDGEKFIVMNGNFPNLNWKTNTDYYIIPSNNPITTENPVFKVFNLCSECSKASVFRIEPPYSILGLEKSEDTNDYVVCQGQIPTLLTDLKGYDLEGKEVPMADLNFDWWLGDKANGVIATLDKYHEQKNSAGTVRLDKALSTLRIYYPDVNSLDGIISHLAVNPNPELTSEMVNYLKELVDSGQLVLHQKSVSIPAEPAGTEDPYFYLVACPIHDEKFDQALNPKANQYIAYFCDEPQGLRVKVGEKAPMLKAGFVPNENGFSTYDYSEAKDAVLSIRLAKTAQFETVRNIDDEATDGSIDATVRYLWLPIRNAQTETADGVVKKAKDDNVYLASSNDMTWDQEIYKAMSQTVPSLPVVGRIVQLTAVNTKKSNPTDPDIDQTTNRLCIYFTKNFEVREGYNYTLSLPFQEVGDVNTCDGTILLNLKIVPDYEVWTGGADNTDWNNDQNWRRADGNTTNSSGVNGDELYRANGALQDAGAPLYSYTTNEDNYYTKKKGKTSKDQIFRKGFAPLYCTHVLIKSDEWGDAPVLYDALDKESGKTELTAKPFPNLRDKDGWDGSSKPATATSILRYDMQARLKDIWEETYGTAPEKGRDGDLLAEMYQINSCDEIVFQPGTELRNAHLLNYNSAWVEYQLENKRWYLLGSPLQGTIAGEWYAPTGTAQQKTTYFDPVIFGPGYDRYAPAIYQRSWDKAKTILYEVGAIYNKDDNPDDLELTEGQLPGSTQQGRWDVNADQGVIWNTTGADEYLDRLGYKPMGANKVNVAMKGIWSNTYNDATVDYTKGGFSVMVMNHLKPVGSPDASGGKAIIRLPKEDPLYFYYKYSEDGSADGGGTKTELEGVRNDLGRNLNRGRLKTDQMLPTSAWIVESAEEPTSLLVKYYDRYGFRTITRVPLKEADLKSMSLKDFTEPISAGISDLGYYLVENPFPCGLDMEKFFEKNKKLSAKYWLLTKNGQTLVQRAANGDWYTPDGTPIEYKNPVDGAENLSFYPTAVVAPGQGFFVQYNPDYDSGGDPKTPPTEITFNHEMQTQTRFGMKTGQSTFTIEVGQRQVMEELKELVDDDNNPETPAVAQTVYVDVDLNDNGIYGETGITIGDKTVDEKEPVMVPVYIDDPDNPGTKIPKLEPITEDVIVYKYVKEKLTKPDDTTFDKEYPLKARTRGEEAEEAVLPGLVITAERSESRSSALVMQHDKASNDFLPKEDTEVFITSDLEQVPTVYTLCGRLATTINSIHDFRCLPVGVESSSAAPCTLTFQGVEMLGDSISFYDAVEQKLTPLTSGMKISVSGQTQNRYYLVRGLNEKEAAEETHLQIFNQGLTVKVIASTAEPITGVRCFDTAGRLIHSANPQTADYSFSLSTSGVYIIDAETENDRKTVKLMVK